MRHLFEYYEFDQLSNSAKENAIDNVREEMYKGNWIGDMDWVIDDDSLFEPSEPPVFHLLITADLQFTWFEGKFTQANTLKLFLLYERLPKLP